MVGENLNDSQDENDFQSRIKTLALASDSAKSQFLDLCKRTSLLNQLTRSLQNELETNKHTVKEMSNEFAELNQTLVEAQVSALSFCSEKFCPILSKFFNDVFVCVLFRMSCNVIKSSRRTSVPMSLKCEI